MQLMAGTPTYEELMSRPDPKGKVSMFKRMEIDASPDEVWAVLGDWGQEARWTSSLTGSYRVDGGPIELGSARHCELTTPFAGNDTVDEYLTVYEPGHRIGYQVAGKVGPFDIVRNIWTLTPGENGGSVVELRPEILGARWKAFLMGWMMKRQLSPLIDTALADFKRYVEDPDKRGTHARPDVVASLRTPRQTAPAATA